MLLVTERCQSTESGRETWERKKERREERCGRGKQGSVRTRVHSREMGSKRKAEGERVRGSKCASEGSRQTGKVRQREKEEESGGPDYQSSLTFGLATQCSTLRLAGTH